MIMGNDVWLLLTVLTSLNIEQRLTNIIMAGVYKIKTSAVQHLVNLQWPCIPELQGSVV